MFTKPSPAKAVEVLIPLLLGLGGIGVLGAQLLGEDKVIDAAEDFGEAVGPVMAATVSGVYSTAKAAIRQNEVEVFAALTVMALAGGAFVYAKTLLSR